MDLKQFWRLFLHRARTNKLALVGGLFVTVFLWHSMILDASENNDSIKESLLQSDHTEDEEIRDSRITMSEGERLRNLDREKEIKIDIRGIRGKLEKIDNLNSKGNKRSQTLYSLTNIDPDAAKGETAQALLGGAFSVLDNFIDTNTSETYKGMKSMLQMWNPKSSKWAARISKKYREALNIRGDRQPPGWTPVNDDEMIWRTVKLDRCGCERKIKGHGSMMVYDGIEEGVNSSVSTCSRHSYLRGAKQRVIGFSFYGNPNSKLGKFRKYFQGIKDNLELVPKFYPGWNIRLYYDLDDDDPLLSDLCEVACNDSNIDLCYVKDIPALGDVSKVFAMNWRFFPMLDPQVSHIVSRDLDSRFNARETAAVQDWLSDNSGAFHVMRDHPAHSIEMLGSGWGVRLGQIERNMVDETFVQAIQDPMFWAVRGAYGPDQGFLKRYIWPWGKWSAVSHDAYTCINFPRTRPFPTQREFNVPNNFVASVVEAQDVMREKCPEKCRPKNHPDWEYC